MPTAYLPGKPDPVGGIKGGGGPDKPKPAPKKKPRKKDDPRKPSPPPDTSPNTYQEHSNPVTAAAERYLSKKKAA